MDLVPSISSVWTVAQSTCEEHYVAYSCRDDGEEVCLGMITRSIRQLWLAEAYLQGPRYDTLRTVELLGETCVSLS
jgi:hypothetical protein